MPVGMIEVWVPKKLDCESWQTSIEFFIKSGLIKYIRLLVHLNSNHRREIETPTQKLALIQEQRADAFGRCGD